MSTTSPDWQNGIDQGDQLGHVASVGPGELGVQRDAFGVGDHVVLADPLPFAAPEKWPTDRVRPLRRS
jgi:hypothetical protein